MFAEHQQQLPLLPLPDLDDTISRYVATVAPMLTDAQLERTRAAVAASVEEDLCQPCGKGAEGRVRGASLDI